MEWYQWLASATIAASSVYFIYALVKDMRDAEKMKDEIDQDMAARDARCEELYYRLKQMNPDAED